VSDEITASVRDKVATAVEDSVLLSANYMSSVNSLRGDG